MRKTYFYLAELNCNATALIASFAVVRKVGLTFVMYTSHFSNFSSFKLIFSHNLTCFTSNPQRLVPSIRIGNKFPSFPLGILGFLSRVGTQNVLLREK